MTGMLSAQSVKPLKINGMIINLLCNRGLSVDSSIELLAKVKRIQTQMPHVNKNVKFGHLTYKRPLREDDLEFHTAHRRIQTLEKVIKNMAKGHPFNLKRRKWRQNGDSKYILETLSHILSRTETKEKSEILKDRQTLLERTSEWCPEDIIPGVLISDYKPKYSDLIPVKIENKNNILNIWVYTDDDDINIFCGNPVSDEETMKIILRLKKALPISIKEAIEEKISLQNIKDNLFSKEAAASNFIDWEAFNGPMKSWLVGITQQQDNMSGYACSLVIRMDYYKAA